ncbi:MAG: LysM repeat protein [Cognaticolwellia sp.]|jgi:LysM repeat protein
MTLSLPSLARISPLLAASLLIALAGCSRTEDSKLGPPDIRSQRALEHAELLDEPSSEEESLQVLAEILAPEEQELETQVSGSFEMQVRPNENLVLIAQWAEIPVDLLLDANPELDAREPLYPGQTLVIPVADATPLEQGRAVWIQGRLDRFMASHGGVAGVEEVRVRSGDTAWGLAEDVGLPMWVLDAYNQKLDLDGLRIGDRVRRPVLMDSVQLQDPTDLSMAEPDLVDELVTPSGFGE